jgi:hypothetical protein
MEHVMPIRKLKFTFDIDAEVLASALMQHNSGMQIQVMGNDDPPELEAAPKRLPPPKKGTVIEAVLKYMRIRKDETVTTREVVVAVIQFGHTANSVYGALYHLRGKGMVRRVGEAQYRLTKNGAVSNG